MVNYTQDQMSTKVPPADLSAALTALHGLSDADLTRLIDDEAYFDQYVQNLTQVKAWEREKEEVMTSNRALAEHNLSFEPKLREGKAALIEKYEKARSLSDDLETKRAQIDSLSSKTSLETTHNLLQASCAEAEEESEQIAEKLLSNELDLDAFLTQFPQLRVKSHLRKLKLDKLTEIINNSRTRPNFSSAPYPTSPQMMMPLPQ